jgi:ATP-binding cassette, subfamily B, bacterial
MSTTFRTLQLYSEQYKKHPWLFLTSLGFGPGFVLQNVISPLFVAKILGELASHRPVNVHYIWFSAIALFSGASITYAADRFGSMPLTLVTTRGLYAKCLDRLLRQEYGFFANNFSGSLVTQANRFAKGYELYSNTVFLEMLGIWCGVLTAIGIMIFYNAALGISVGLLWATAIVVVITLTLRRMPIRRWAVTKESQLTGELADAITNATAIKTFAAETAEKQRYDVTNYEHKRRLFRSWCMAINNHAIMQTLCIALLLIVLIGGVLGVQHGSLTVATFLLFQVYILRIIDSVAKASLEMRSFEGVFGDAAEMTELIDRTPLILDPEQPEPCRIKKGAIDFRDVQFKYNEQKDDTPILLKDFNLRIAPGERVGLVGPSGGGKTTLTKLLLRFMDVQGGKIGIDGQDIRAITQDDLHASISYVPQEPLLFHRSIRENIRYGRPDASDAEIVKAAKQSHTHEFIKDLPDGYNTIVGERGVKLSGGQRQRVAIARAMLKKAPILLLDEATSALDSESEVYIQESLWKLMQGKTTLVIAHRLSTIQRLDRIVVLDNGKIIEEGTHKELLQHKGLYARLWKHQSGGFMVEE